MTRMPVEVRHSHSYALFSPSPSLSAHTHIYTYHPHTERERDTRRPAARGRDGVVTTPNLLLSSLSSSSMQNLHFTLTEDVIARAPPPSPVLLRSGLQFSVRVGKVTGLLGASGAGKTTLLNTLTRSGKHEAHITARHGDAYAETSVMYVKIHLRVNCMLRMTWNHIYIYIQGATR